MIKHLEIRRFKSIREAVIDCTRVNVFIGKPNVGKSNFLEAFSLFSNPYNSVRSIRIKELPNLFYFNSYADPIEIAIDGERAIITSQDDRCKHIRLNFPQKLALIKTLEKNDNIEFIGYNIREDRPNYFQVNPINMPEKYFEKFNSIKRYFFHNEPVESLQPGMMTLSTPSGTNLYNILSKNKELLSEISFLFGEYNNKLKINTISQRIELQKDIDEFTITSFDYDLTADSLKRLIFHITAIKSNENSVIAFEEPEAHTYAPYTIRVAELISNDDRGNQFFVTTHSPYFLSTIFENVSPEDLSVFFVTYENDSTQIRKATESQMYEMQKLGVDPFLNMSVI
jgi:AAA15 family ATPase/GTPase